MPSRYTSIGPLASFQTTMADVQLVELKNGVTFNGHLVECDNFMNVTLREVYQTSADGERFFKMKEMFIKGNIVRIPSRLRHRQTRWNAVDLTV